MKRVLFVDGSPRVLEGLEHTLHPLRHEWDMDFAASSREALWCLTESKYDVLVTSIHMPEVDGIALLSEAIRICPQTVRIILCGKDDPDVVLRSVSLAHQYLVKPCDAHALQATVEKALASEEKEIVVVTQRDVAVDSPAASDLANGMTKSG